jgi:16S rRNA C1402 N4-methylase RsmH
LRSVRRIRASRDASTAERASNPRSTSARLRVVEKLHESEAK